MSQLTAARFATPLVERFEPKVNRSPGLGPNGDCHLWMAAVNEQGYGIIRRGRQGEGSARAHVVAWFVATGSWPELFVLHRCDNPPCVNPAHLFLGGYVANRRDMVKKDRHIYGERSPNAKLTEGQVREIKTSSAMGKSLAVKYGVSQATICQIRKGHRWKHL